MKRTVTITFEIDATEYESAEDTPSGCIDLTLAFLRNEADMPEKVSITCEGLVRQSKDHFE